MDIAVTRDAAISAEDDALRALLAYLAAHDYEFVTPTPATHARVLARRRHAKPGPATLRDIFGWSAPFDLADVPPEVLALLKQAKIMQPVGYQYKSLVRVSSLEGMLLLHSSYPTEAANAVFFGPDTYRFCCFIRRHARRDAHLRILDVGCGSGAGALTAVHASGSGQAAVMNDTNPLALRYARINAAHAGIATTELLAGSLASARSDFDLIVANPPYLHDDSERTYRHGGERLGRALSVRMAQDAIAHLAPGGTLLLYTGVAIVDGVDHLLEELLPLLVAHDMQWTYDELDPDVFGEELEREIYAQAERIAVTGLVATKRL
ncbi:MAG TPA: class I SAM-dependent methyltransferase [Burkholderiaceae bacterium]